MSFTSLPSSSLPPLSPPPPPSNSAASPRPAPSSIPHAQRTAEARAAFVASLSAVGASLSSDLQSRARTIHENARALDAQERKLAQSTRALQKDTIKLEKFVAKNNKGGKGAMSEFDDLEGLLAGLEGELDVLERTLGEVEGRGMGDYVEEEEGEAAGEVGDSSVRRVEGLEEQEEESEQAAEHLRVEPGQAQHAVSSEGIDAQLAELHVSDTGKGKERAVETSG